MLNRIIVMGRLTRDPELRKTVRVSDRKYLNYYPIAQARAWLNGHTAVETTDLLALKCYLWEKPEDIPAIEATLNRMCVNPLQEKVNGIRAVAKEVFDDLEKADAAKLEPRKSFRKFRSELVRVYGLYTDLAAKAATDSEKAMLDGLLADLEKDSRSAHEKHGYTYATLKELAELQ